MTKPESSRQGFEFELPFPGKSKARPKFNSETQTAYMPKDYMDWKEKVVELLAYTKHPVLQGPVSLVAKFYPNRVAFMLAESSADRHGRSDIDNLVGGLMDALQDAGVYKNDSQVQRIMVEIVQEKEKEVKRWKK